MGCRHLGFELLYGGERAAFSSLKVGEAFVNLVSSRGYEHRWWGRVIFRVDCQHRYKTTAFPSVLLLGREAYGEDVVRTL